MLHMKMKEELRTGLDDRHLDWRSKGMVGTAGFEPTTTTPPVWCATRLRYAPILCYFKGLDLRPTPERGRK